MSKPKWTYYFIVNPKLPHDYVVGMASTRDSRLWYAEHEWKHIPRDLALKLMRQREHHGQRVICTLRIDTLMTLQSRFDIARRLKNGQGVETSPAEDLSLEVLRPSTHSAT